MNKRELKVLIKRFEKHATKVHKEDIGVNEEKQKNLHGYLKDIGKILGDDFVYHYTLPEVLLKILDDNKLKTYSYPREHYLDPFGVLINQNGGHMEQVLMSQQAHNLYIDNKYKVNNDLDYQKRIHTLLKLSKDIEPKVFVTDDITFFVRDKRYLNDLELKHKNHIDRDRMEGSFNQISKNGTAILVFNKRNLDLHKKYFYWEDTPELNESFMIQYYIGDDEESKYMLDWIKSMNTVLEREEFVSYEDVLLDELEYIILIDKYNITHIIQKDGDKHTLLNLPNRVGASV